MSLGERLDATRQVGPGFHTMRWTLAILVVCFHSVPITQGEPAGHALFANPWFGPVVGAVLPLFFAVGGFLVLASAMRVSSPAAYLMLRARRILPALCIVTLVTVLVIGPLATRLPVGSYFAQPATALYLGNMAGRVQLSLPGVFEANPWPMVNISLWTIPGEMLGYVIAFLCAYVGLVRRPLLALALLVGYSALNLLADATFDRLPTDGYPARLLILAFCFGCALYLFRHRLPYSAGLFAAAALGTVLSSPFPVLSTLNNLCVAYCGIFLGLSDLRIKLPILSSADLSYGIYLYGCPIQQLVQAGVPEAGTWWANLLLSLPATLACAALSWYWIEKPAMRLKWREARSAMPPTLLTQAGVITGLVVFGAYMCSTGHIAEIGFATLLRDPAACLPIAGLLALIVAGLLLIALQARSIRLPGEKVSLARGPSPIS